MNSARFGVERFPSLVEAVLALREASWREWDEQRTKNEARKARAASLRATHVRRRRSDRTPADVEAAIRERHKAGMALKAIAKAFSVDRQTVRRIVRRGGVEEALATAADARAIRDVFRKRRAC